MRGRLRAQLGDPRALYARAQAQPLTQHHYSDYGNGMRAALATATADREAKRAALRDWTAAKQSLNETPRSPGYTYAFANFLHAGLLQDAGRVEEALAWFKTFGNDFGYDVVFFAPAALRRAQIFESRGDTVAAAGTASLDPRSMAREIHLPSARPVGDRCTSSHIGIFIRGGLLSRHTPTASVTTTAQADGTPMPESRRRALRAWFWSVAAMTFAVVVVGGITRLTLSGLSIVDWRPLTGVIPPLTDAQWQHAFDQYKQFPEFQTWRQAMSLAQFKGIYFWEYLHRLLARTIGLVFLFPFVFFWLRGYLDRPLLRRSLALFALGAMQGVMGWLMVASGLVDRPSVSHYRLAAHLCLALLIFSWAIWLAQDMRARATTTVADEKERRLMLRGLGLVGALLAVQIVWGALVAGLKAGKYYTTFPLMGGRWIPSDLLRANAGLDNFIAHPVAVQWLHRVIGTVLAVAAVVFMVTVWRRVTDGRSRRFNLALASLIGFQYLLGVLTLIRAVPVSLGVLHQATAVTILGVWVCWLHHVMRLNVGPTT